MITLVSITFFAGAIGVLLYSNRSAARQRTRKLQSWK